MHNREYVRITGSLNRHAATRIIELLPKNKKQTRRIKCQNLMGMSSSAKKGFIIKHVGPTRPTNILIKFNDKSLLSRTRHTH